MNFCLDFKALAVPLRVAPKISQQHAMCAGKWKQITF